MINPLNRKILCKSGQTWNWVTICDPFTQWPVTRESSDPETQLTRWPCSIMNSKCRLMLQTNVCSGQEVCQFYRCSAFARFWKVKFWRSFMSILERICQRNRHHKTVKVLCARSVLPSGESYLIKRRPWCIHIRQRANQICITCRKF